MIAGYATLERQAAQMQRQIRDLRQTVHAAAVPARSPLVLAAALGVTLDGWQRDALTTDRHDILLLVSRQGGKGMVASLLALHALVSDPGSTTIIVSRADRQAKRLMRRVRRLYHSLTDAPPAIAESQFGLQLRNGSELLALPGSEETIRGIEAVDLLIVDEAALVPDELYLSVRPMLATTNGRTVALSTPRGRRGWFHREWEEGGPDWHRARVPATEIPRISPAWLAKERDRIGDWWYRQEYGVEFLDTDDQLYASDLVEAVLSGDFAPLFGGIAA